ncbi:hypothetical protein [Halioxenophilus aromaticivorans]|uniref:Secreted protein n=1 Tax=Halioxenophilus aromaticivorans TaxID=1306992 RepID=A0AAV3U1Z5_9ALTE
MIASLLLQSWLVHACNEPAKAQAAADKHAHSLSADTTTGHCRDGGVEPNPVVNSEQHPSADDASKDSKAPCDHCDHGHCSKAPSVTANAAPQALIRHCTSCLNGNSRLPKAPITNLEHPPKVA